MAGRKVHAGIGAAQLLLLPAHGAMLACVYAQSSKALLLRPSSAEHASGQVLTLIRSAKSTGPKA